MAPRIESGPSIDCTFYSQLPKTPTSGQLRVTMGPNVGLLCPNMAQNIKKKSPKYGLPAHSIVREREIERS